MPRVKKARVISVIAHCQDCGESFEDYETAREEARKHARKHKHLVTGDFTTSFRYNGRKNKEDR